MEEKNSGCSTFFWLLIIVAIGYFGYNELVKPEDTLDNNENVVSHHEHTRTIMMYMAPADLESDGGYATQDLNSLDVNKFDFEHNKLVIMAGGTNKWHNSFTKETSIYEYTPSGMKKIGSAGIYQNMGDYNSLTYFLNFVKSVSAYNSDEYILYFYGHGYGVNGVLPDEVYNDNISLADLAFAINNSDFGYLKTREQSLDLVIFNSCMIGTYETYAILNTYAKYVIASEELTWFVKDKPLFSVFNEITKEDDIETVGRKYIDKYKTIASSLYGYKHNLSLVKTSDLLYTPLYLSNLFENIDINRDYEKIKNIRKGMLQFGDEAYIDEVDMYNMMTLFKDYDIDSYDKFKEVFDKAIVYNFSNNSGMNGISIHFPYFDCTDKDYYMIENTSIIKYQNNGYYNFINEFVKRMEKECNYK